MSAAIEASGLGKSFGRAVAHDSVSFEVDRGSVFGMIGPNGAGKTTAMRLMLDLVRPTSGALLVLGLSPRAGSAELRKRIGYLPGELRLEGRVTGRTLLGHYTSISGTVAPRASEDLADRLGLDLSRQVRTLSKGNKQKLGLVQAFMHSPELLVLDEPTSGLDPLVQQTFLAMVREATDAGQTVFLSSHVLSEIEDVADSVAILRAGRIVTVSDVESLRLTAIRRVRFGVRGGFGSGGLNAGGADAADIRSAFETLPGVTAFAVDGDRVDLTVEGDIDPVVKALARFTVIDLVVEEPDLEESVLRLYESGASR